MHLADPEQLEHVGLTLYERKALMALMLCGVADAATLCREGSVPSSKVYLAMEKLAALGLMQVQPTRPKMFAALPSEVVASHRASSEWAQTSIRPFRDIEGACFRGSAPLDCMTVSWHDEFVAQRHDRRLGPAVVNGRSQRWPRSRQKDESGNRPPPEGDDYAHV